MNLCTGHNIGTRLLSACLAFGTAIVMLMPKHTVAETEMREVSFPTGRQVVQVTDAFACDLSKKNDGIVTIYVRQAEAYAAAAAGRERVPLSVSGTRSACAVPVPPVPQGLPATSG